MDCEEDGEIEARLRDFFTSAMMRQGWTRYFIDGLDLVRWTISAMKELDCSTFQILL